MEKLPLIKVEINLYSDGSWIIKGGKLEEVPEHFLDAVVAHLTESMNQRIELVPKKQPGKAAPKPGLHSL